MRVMVVDDFEPFRRRIGSILQEVPELNIVCEASDGLEAVQKAVEMQPDVILLDIGLPKLNGIEAAGRIRNAAPNSKILFVSTEQAADIIEQALAVDHCGYLVKCDLAAELMLALRAVKDGRQYISQSAAMKY